MSGPSKSSGRDIGRSRSDPKSGGTGVSNHRPSRDPRSNLFLNTEGLPKEFAGVPKLRRNERTRQADNLPEFLNKMYESMSSVIGSIAIVITTSDWPYHEPIPVPPLASITLPPEGTDVGGAQAKLYAWRIQDRERMIQDEQKVQGPRAFGIFIRCIPDYFRVQIEATADYDRDVYRKSDFRELVRRLKRVAGSDPADPIASGYSMRQEYNAAIHQGKDETLESYFKRVRDIMDRCAEVTPIPVYIGNAQEIAMDFLGGADPVRYGRNKLDLQNAVKAGTAQWPADLQAAYTRLDEYIVPILKESASETVSGSVFATTKSGAKFNQDSGHKKISGDHSKEKKPNEPKAAKGNNNSNNNRKPLSPPNSSKARPPREYKDCPLCKLHGHRLLDCPDLKECQAIHSSKKAGIALLTQEDPDSDDDIANFAYSVSKQNHSAFMVKSDPTNPLPKPTTVEVGVVHVARPESFTRNQVLLDNQSTVDLFFNPDLLSNIRPIRKPVSIGGIGPGSLIVTQRGIFQDYGPV